MKDTFIALFSILVMVAACGLPAASSAQEDESPLVGKSAPSFELNSYRGEAVSTDSFRGKVLLVVFIVPGLPESAQAISLLESLYAAHKKDGLEIVAIDMKGRKKAAEQLKKQQEMTINMLQGNGRMAMVDWEVRFSPTYYLIDRKGVVRHHYDQKRALDHKLIQSDISELLK